MHITAKLITFARFNTKNDFVVKKNMPPNPISIYRSNNF